MLNFLSGINLHLTELTKETYFSNSFIGLSFTQGCRNRVGRGAIAAPDFGRSVNPIPTRGGGQIIPLTLLQAPPDSKSYLHLCIAKYRGPGHFFGLAQNNNHLLCTLYVF